MLASVELKKRENRDDLEFFTNERLRTLYIYSILVKKNYQKQVPVVVDHIRASALTTADLRPPSWNRITNSTHAPPVGNGIGEPHLVKFIIKCQYHRNCS